VSPKGGFEQFLVQTLLAQNARTSCTTVEALTDRKEVVVQMREDHSRNPGWLSFYSQSGVSPYGGCGVTERSFPHRNEGHLPQSTDPTYPTVITDIHSKPSTNQLLEAAAETAFQATDPAITEYVASVVGVVSNDGSDADENAFQHSKDIAKDLDHPAAPKSANTAKPLVSKSCHPASRGMITARRGSTARPRRFQAHTPDNNPMKPKTNIPDFLHHTAGASLVTAITVCFSPAAIAADVVWNGSASNDWTVGGNLTPDHTPDRTAGENAAINILTNHPLLTASGFGATITTKSVHEGAGGTSTFNFNGGKLVAGPGANSAFMYGMDNVVIKVGGAFIDSVDNEFTSTQSSPMTLPTAP
jgi:hypothetical protein